MAAWLFKQEPSCYSWAQLVRDKRTLWDGVSNALALKHLRQVKPGERVFFYHTGKEKAVVGEMCVVQVGPDPADASPGKVVVEVEAVQPLPRSVSLAEIKADARLASWDLVRLPRLSVVPVSAEQWARIEALSRAPNVAAP
jgi:predicted RNA-binding protein with PUA-like domain